MDDLTAFLAARYDEAEAAAKAAAGATNGHWLLTGQGRIVRHSDTPGKAAVAGGLYNLLKPAHAAHIAACDPAHRLADIALKRAILAEHLNVGGSCRICIEWPPKPYPCPTVRQLGTEFSGHDDYDPSWAPEGSHG